MVFIVVQWVNENSVSVVHEKKVVGENVELKEGSTVDVSAGISKGRIAIYKAEILKVCGKCSTLNSLMVEVLKYICPVTETQNIESITCTYAAVN